MAYEHVLSPLEIGGRRVRNRVLVTGHSVLYGQDGRFSDRHVAYYRERARGGAAIVITEQQAANPQGRNYRSGLWAYDRAALPAWQKLTKAVQGEGALVYAQLFCGGPQGMSTQYMDDWSPLQSPSGVRSTQFGEIPAVMSLSDIAELRESFAASARNLVEGGFDGIEIHAAHSQLLGSFLSPAFNKRTDSYGGSVANRCRVVVEILETVREAVGHRVHVGLRLGATEHLGASGLQEDEALEQAMMLARTGAADFLDISAGGYFAKSVSVPPMASPLPTGFLREFTARLKSQLPAGIAVFSVGRVTTLVQADELIGQKACDMIGMTRAHMADPELVAKAADGRPVTHCIGANVCARRLVGNLPVACVLNPRMGREDEPRRARSRTEARRVVVVGAGPCGLKAAAAAAAKGHSVELIERSGQAGGRMKLLPPLPFRRNWKIAIEDMVRDAEAAGAVIRLGEEGTVERIAALNPDYVLVATGSDWETTGATPFRPERDRIDGLGSTNVELLPLDRAVARSAENPRALGKRVLIVDETFDSAAAALSILLAEAGAAVTVLTPAASYADHLFQTYELPYFMRRIEQSRVEIVCGATLDACGEDGHVEAGSLYSDRKERYDAVETIVFAAGRIPRRELADKLLAAGIAATVIGDARAPRSLEAVIRDGYRAGATLEFPIPADAS